MEENITTLANEITTLANEFFTKLKNIYAANGRELTKLHIIPFDNAAVHVDEESANKAKDSSLRDIASDNAREELVDDQNIIDSKKNCVYIPGVGVLCL